MEKPLTEKIMRAAFNTLDGKLNQNVTLIMGGGGAMILAHHYPLATTDVDAIPKGMEIHELDQYIKSVAIELNLPGDWLNPYFSSFSHTLPADYSERLIQVFSGKRLSVEALGKEEMLIMKCFAHREKDVGHAKQLIKLGADLKLVEKQIELMRSKKIPQSNEALDFLDDLLEQME
ncbi:MAG: hypothetical protein JNL11_02370 [Bdellovibrionaceae bacterium]|nr:hypothetical protein [Pseudobdellovibrionaceae bacterium]